MGISGAGCHWSNQYEAFPTHNTTQQTAGQPTAPHLLRILVMATFQLHNQQSKLPLGWVASATDLVRAWPTGGLLRMVYNKYSSGDNCTSFPLVPKGTLKTNGTWYRRPVNDWSLVCIRSHRWHIIIASAVVQPWPLAIFNEGKEKCPLLNNQLGGE